MASISVIVPTYNRAGLIGETLESVLAQTRAPDEVLVLDDGSGDETAAMVARFAPAVRYLRQENAGKAAALNRALGETRGDFVWIVDDDDIVLPEACARLAGALEADPALGYCAGRHEDFTVDAASGEKRVKPAGYWRASQPGEIFPDLLDGCHVFQPGLIVRREVYRRVGPFNARLVRSQDYEMMLRLARTTPGRLLAETVFLHREHQGARGSGADRFSAAEQVRKWAAYNRIIFSALMDDLAPREHLPVAVWDDPARAATRARTLLLKRAGVFARQLMWPEAFASWQAAADGSPAVPFDALERGIVRQATMGPLGSGSLFTEPRVMPALKVLHDTPSGREIAGLLARSVRWQVKRALQAGDVARAARIGRFIAAGLLAR